MTDMILKVAAKAVVINDDGKVLLLREASTNKEGTNLGRYCNPGGRLNPGETYEDGLRREVMEETGLSIELLYPIYVGEWHPVINGIPHQIIAIFTVCKAGSSEVKLSEEHDDYKWIKAEDRNKYDIMEPEGKVLDRYGNWLSRKLPK
jgi:8-oxo-dGTP diphosphatase